MEINTQQITIDQVLTWNLCPDYNSREKLLQITDGRESLTPIEITWLDISARDIFCLIFRPEVISSRALRLFACDCAEHVAYLWNAPEGCAWKPSDTIAVARAFARGEASVEEIKASAAIANDYAWEAWEAGGGWFESAFSSARAAEAACESIAEIAAIDASSRGVDSAASAARNESAEIGDSEKCADRAASHASVIEGDWQLAQLRTRLTEDAA